VKNRVKSTLLIFFDIKGIVHEEFVLAGQTVNSAYYCDVIRRLRENVGRLRPEIWREKNWLLHHDNVPPNTSFFTREFLTKRNVTVVSYPPYFSLLSRLKMKVKGHHFDIIEVIEAELPVVLNTLTEHDFQDVFRKGQNR
jgi:hypothetical protein